jgi:hypothetical protein
MVSGRSGAVLRCGSNGTPSLVFVDDGKVVEAGNPAALSGAARHERTSAFLSRGCAPMQAAMTAAGSGLTGMAAGACNLPPSAESPLLERSPA